MKALSKISLLAIITLIVTGSDRPGRSQDKNNSSALGARPKTTANNSNPAQGGAYLSP